MSLSATDHQFVERAQAYWAGFQRDHDLTAYLGQVAGIDPDGRRVWFGESPLAIVRQRQGEGLTNPLYFVRVGRDYLYRKGGRRSC